MKRVLLAGVALLAAAAIAIPTVAMAQGGAPPPPPATYYGKTPAGISAGQGVIAIVIDGQSSTVCGAGASLIDSDTGDVVYVVDVATDAQIRGCGLAGREILFYFTPTAASSGRLTTDVVTWSGAGPVNQNLTGLGPQLTRIGVAPQVASDGPTF
jgi:hypothetical protein